MLIILVTLQVVMFSGWYCSYASQCSLAPSPTELTLEVAPRTRDEVVNQLFPSFSGRQSLTAGGENLPEVSTFRVPQVDDISP